MPAYSTDKGFTGNTRDKPKAGGSSSVAGAGTQGYTQRRDPAGPDGAISGGSGAGPGAKSYSSKQDRGGGTTTTDKYVPGAVENRPLADVPTVAEKIVGPLVPGVGATLGLATAARMLSGEDDGSGTVMGGDPGPQRGWQPDRYRGAASLGGIGGSGGAVSDEAGFDREIAGRSIRAEPKSSTDDETDSGAPYSGNDVYSDVMLKDRRRPALKDMLEAML